MKDDSRHEFRSLAMAGAWVLVSTTVLIGWPANRVFSQESPGATIRLRLGEQRPTYPPAELVELDNPQEAACVHHLVTARLDPEGNFLEADDQMTIVHPPGVATSTPFSFLLWRDLELLAVASDAVTLTSNQRERLNARSFWKRPPYDELEGYERARQIDLTLEGIETWPETLSVTVQYAGTVLDSLHPPRVAYGRSFDTTAGLIVKEGAFLAASSFWVPTRPDEVFTFELRAEVPAGWRSVSQGRMATARSSDDRQFTRWVCPDPMEEIYLVAGPWEECHLRHGNVFARTFTYADTDSSIYNRYLRGTGRYLDRYEEEIGPYPFAKFAMVENFWQTGFGMPSFTLLGDRVIRLPFILDTSYGHEILHNWWGNGVFVKSEEGNWCEGLTTYGADYAYKEDESPAAAREYRLNALKNYLDYVSEGEDLPLARFRERHDFTTQAVGYSKSMMVFHQIRRELGDEAFRDGLQQFYREFLWKRASWSDLFDSFAAQLPLSAEQRGPWTVRQLGQWIDRTGAPVLRLQAATSLRAGSGWSVDVRVAQENGTDGGPFSIQVPVRVSGEEGQVADATLELNELENGINVRCAFEPLRVEIDPDFEVMRRLHREEIPVSLSQVLGADSVVFVVADQQPEDLTAALLDLAETWARDQRATVVLEADLGPGAGDNVGQVALSRGNHSVWFLGAGPWARRLIGELDGVERSGPAWQIDGSSYSQDDSFVLTGLLSGDSAWGAVVPAGADVVAAVGRKIPHYGKYSYLVFEGETNVGKGVWKVGASPLAREIGR